MKDTAAAGGARTGDAPPTVVVRVPRAGWPGKGLADALGAGFLVITTRQILADVILVTGVSASDVQRLRAREPQAAIMVQTTPNAVVDLLSAGADAVVTSPPLVEIAARIRAMSRSLLIRRPDEPRRS